MGVLKRSTFFPLLFSHPKRTCWANKRTNYTLIESMWHGTEKPIYAAKWKTSAMRIKTFFPLIISNFLRVIFCSFFGECVCTLYSAEIFTRCKHFEASQFSCFVREADVLSYLQLKTLEAFVMRNSFNICGFVTRACDQHPNNIEYREEPNETL